MQIKGIGEVKAAAIVKERRKGKFKSFDDLAQRVPGIGDQTAANIKHGVENGEKSAAISKTKKKRSLGSIFGSKKKQEHGKKADKEEKSSKKKESKSKKKKSEKSKKSKGSIKSKKSEKSKKEKKEKANKSKKRKIKSLDEKAKELKSKAKKRKKRKSKH